MRLICKDVVLRREKEESAKNVSAKKDKSAKNVSAKKEKSASARS